MFLPLEKVIKKKKRIKVYYEEPRKFIVKMYYEEPRKFIVKEYYEEPRKFIVKVKKVYCYL